jgi:hypothetical protein
LDKILGILLIALLALVTAVSISYYVLNQPNPTQNNPSTKPTPSPSGEPTEPASTSEPSVPEFSLKVVAHPYDVPPTTTTDPYTGENIITSYGYREENKSVEITVENQPFTSTLDASGNYTSLYYGVRFKGSYTDEWSQAYSEYNASKFDYTVISISLRQIGSVSVGDKIDFQVRALIGYEVTKAYDSILPPEMKYYHEFIGQAGDWSSTQNISVP